MEIMDMASRPRSSECSDKIKKGLNAIMRLYLPLFVFNPKRLPGKTVNHRAIKESYSNFGCWCSGLRRTQPQYRTPTTAKKTSPLLLIASWQQ